MNKGGILPNALFYKSWWLSLFILLTVDFPMTLCPSKTQKVAVVFFCLAHPECWDSCWSTVSFALYKPCQHRAPHFLNKSQQRSNFCWRDLWQKSGMRKPQLFFFGPCPLIFNHMSSGRLSEDDMWWDVCGSGVVFWLITWRSGRYGSPNLPRKGRKSDMKMKWKYTYK